MRSPIMLAVAFGCLTLGSPTTAWSVIFSPGQSVPAAPSEVFPWAAGAAHSTSALWERFDDFPGGSAPGFLPTGTSPEPQASFTTGTEANSLTFQSNQSLASSGNAYGGLFGPGDDSTFLTDAYLIVRSGITGGDFTRIVVQFETLGSELDYQSILLSDNTTTPGSVAPSFSIETDRQALGGTFGGDGVSHLAVFDLPSSAEAYRVDFQATSTNLSIDRLRVDSLVQNRPFVVPEPTSSIALALAIGGWSLRRRRSIRATAKQETI